MLWRALLFLLLSLSGICQEGLQLVQVQQLGALKLGASEASLKKILGAPSQVGKAHLEGATGLYVQSREYARLGLSLTWSRENAKTPWKVERFRAESPCTWRTPQGIGIGSSGADVRRLYAALIEGDAARSEQIVVGTVYDGVIFELKEDRVVSVFVGAAAE